MRKRPQHARTSTGTAGHRGGAARGAECGGGEGEGLIPLFPLASCFGFGWPRLIFCYLFSPRPLFSGRGGSCAARLTPPAC
eukprot:scaffold13929_cov97-Isochrysis_galbana.AAC.4